MYVNKFHKLNKLDMYIEGLISQGVHCDHWLCEENKLDNKKRKNETRANTQNTIVKKNNTNTTKKS